MSALAPSVSPPPGPRRRRTALAGLALAALFAHMGVLSGLGPGDSGRAPTPPNPSLDVRTIAGDGSNAADVELAPPPAEVPVVPRPTPHRVASVRAARATRVAPAESAASATVIEVALPEPVAPSAPDAVVTEATTLVASAASEPRAEAASAPFGEASGAASAVAASASADASAAGGATTAPAGLAGSASDELVVRAYRTQVPPAMTLAYEVRRGFLRGQGEVRWRPSGAAYSLVLQARVGGFTLLTQTSEGGFDGAGLAPVRFLDERARRAPVAANFQRTPAKVTFSGSPVELPLLPGTQDRISWMVQVAAILSAEPDLAAPGGSVAMYVVGARGDAAVWVLRFVGMEFIDTVDGSLRAAHFTRDARGPYDTTVDLWVDPARYHLPVRAKQRSGNDEFDLLLQGMTPG